MQRDSFSLGSAKKASARRRWNVGGNNQVKDSLDDMLDDIDFSSNFASKKPVNQTMTHQNATNQLHSPTKLPNSNRRKSIFDDDFDDDFFS